MRLGSYVQEIGEREFVFVTEIRENNLRLPGQNDTYHLFTNKSHGYCRAKDYEPIPLTPKILEHCGLKQNADGYWRHFMFSIEDLEDGQYGVCWGDSYFSVGTYIEYLHELQNVYLALMGEELKFDNYTERELSDDNEDYDDEDEENHNPFVDRDTFNALTDGQLGRYEDFHGTLDELKAWMGRG